LSPRLQSDAILARLYAYNGSSQQGKVMLLLEQAYKERSAVLTNIKVDPKYDNLRKDERFQDLLARISLGR
jgi:hypothetical protein